MISLALGYGAVGIAVAVLGGGLWALVAANASQAALNTALLLSRKPHAFRFRVHRKELGELLSFTGGFSLRRFRNHAARDGGYLGGVGLGGVRGGALVERAYH